MLLRVMAVACWVFVLSAAAYAAEVPGLRRGGITAEDRDFWSFQPIRDVSVPSLEQGGDWARSPVDFFILEKLQARDVTPVELADRRTLLRRVTLDLTGLPPTPEETERFLTDAAPGAYSRLVDRLLASPAHGERWGRHWLDVVRYADTAGETADYPLPEGYRYRNYVVDAFNQDKPFDEFVREQIAGDIIAQRGPLDRYAERSTATGFIAQSRRFGYDSEKYQYMTIQDTIDTVGQAFLGLSLGCARCHDHKFDPVSAEDYYALYGFFASTRYSFPGSEQKPLTRSYIPLMRPDEAAACSEAFDQEITRLEKEISQLRAKPPRVSLGSVQDIDGDFELQKEARGGSDGVPVDPWQFAGGVLLEKSASSPWANVYRPGQRGINFPGDAGRHALWQRFMQPFVAATDKSVHFNIDLRTARALTEDSAHPSAARPERQRVEAADGAKGAYRFYLGRGSGDSAAVEFFVSPAEADGGGRLTLRSGEHLEELAVLEPEVWYNVQLELNLESRRYSGTLSGGKARVPFADKSFAPQWSGRIDHVLIDEKGPTHGAKPVLEIDNVAIRATPLPAPPAEPGAPAKGLSQEEAESLAAEEKKRREKIAQAKLDELVERVENGPYPKAYGVAEGYPQNARLQERGDPLTLGKEVPRRWLEVLGGDPLPPDHEGSGRLQLAEWLAGPDNPLTARVIANRIWQHHFGHGLVRTENDFGMRGQPPTHPDLLDYLAKRLVDSGWSIKELHRLIVLSTTYRLSSREDSQAARLDPAVKLRWRFEKRRLDAETIRDSLLFVSGRLDRTIGTKHPFPSMVKHTYSQHNPFRGLYETRRRSIYLMTQRTARHPFLSLFDAPDRNTSIAKRATTTVPTQALYFMNSPFVHEQASGLALRLLTAGPFGAASETEAARVNLAYRIALGRPPSALELADDLAFLQAYGRELEEAGEPSATAEGEQLKLAAFSRTLLTRNEFLYVD